MNTAGVVSVSSLSPEAQATPMECFALELHALSGVQAACVFDIATSRVIAHAGSVARGPDLARRGSRRRWRRRFPGGRRGVRDVLRGELAAILDETRRLGYASRDPQFGGADDKDISVVDDRIDAIAVPVMAGPRILAAMNLVWPRKYKLKAQIVAEHLADLQEAAAAIAAAASQSA